MALRFRAGDRGAFAAFARRYMRRAFYYSLSLVGNVEDARDLTQDVFLKAFQRRGDFDVGRPFLP